MIPIAYNTRSLWVRKTTTLASGLGITLVVFVLAAAMMLAEGVERTLGQGGRADTAVVLRKGSDAELTSSIDEPAVGLILATPGVRHDAGGAPLGVAEIVTVVAAEKLGTDGVSNLQIRGVPDNVLRFRDGVRLVAGRPAQPGTDEVIVGQRVRGRFKGVDLGQSFELRKDRPVRVVGVFSDGGSAHESEVWASLDTVRTSFGREGLVSSVRVRLEGSGKFDTFRAQVEQDKQLGLLVQRETDFLRKQSEGTALFVGVLGNLIAFFFSLGAMIGAMITMYASIASRQHEIGTLRALGFPRRSVLASFLLEAVVLAGCGGLAGALASLGMVFVKFSMINFATWSEIVFSFHPTAAILLRALAFAGLMGILGGFLPAWRASRLSPVEAMRG